VRPPFRPESASSLHRIGSGAGVEEVIDAFAGVPLDRRTLALARGSERLLGA
jgi:hypothetical protein